MDREFTTKVACKDGRESNLAVAWKLEVLAIIDARGTFFFPALPGEYETLSVNYWNLDEIKLITAEIPWKQANNQTRQTQPKQHKHQTPAPPPGKFAKQGETR